MIQSNRSHVVISIFLTIVLLATCVCQFNTSVPLQASEPSSAVQPRVYAPEDEIVNERTENAKKFHLGENLYALDVSIGAIHYKDNYQDPSEQWKDIDLTFDENNRITRAPYDLTVDSANYSLTVKDKKTGQITTLKMTKVGDQETKDIKKAANISKSKILWSEVAADLDVAITPDNTRVRFDWIVKSESAPHQVEFEIDDGGIPILYRGVDAEGEMVAVTAEKTGNKIIEKIEKGGKYPIIINPSIEFQIGSSTDDGTINTWGEEYYYPDLASNWVGFYGYQYYGTYFQYHSWYRWTGFTIPSGSTINSNSYISLYADNTPSYRPETIIYFDNEASPSYPTGVSDYLYRPLTSNYVPFSPGLWTYQTWYYSDSIQNILQELVNSYGSISVLQCMHQDCTPFINYIVKILKNGAYDTSAIYSPKIHIEYSPPPPAAPTAVSATDGTYSDKVQITWTASSGATSYKVYRHTSNDSGSASLIGTPSTTSFDDTSAVAGTTYYYWVKAHNDSGDSGFSNYDTGWRALPPPAAPTNVSASDGTYTTYVRITWTASSGATGYKIFRNTWNDSGTANQIGTDTASPYDDTSVSIGTTYYYWVKAYNANGDSAFSASDTGWQAVAAPTNVAASDGTYSDKIQLSWTASSGATEYHVFRSTTSISLFATLIGTVTASPFDDISANVGTTYYYWVKASISQGDSAFSSYNSGWRAVAPPTNVSATDGTFTDKVQISWTASTGATGYRIYRNTSNDSGTATQVGTSTASPYNNTTAVVGTTYYYWVKAYNSKGNSVFSDYDTGWRGVATPTNVAASDGTYSDKIQISWTASIGAIEYHIYRNTTNSSGTATLIGTVTASPYDDNTVAVNTTYYYWVKASISQGDSGFSTSDQGNLLFRKNLGVAVASDWTQVWQDDVVNFANNLRDERGWNQSFVNGGPDRTWWQEETPNGPIDGQDNTKTDSCELSLLMTHGADTSPISQIAFPVGSWLDDPNTVRLGYVSPDNVGYNIWNFFISCYTLKDSSYPFWQSILRGSHMVLGFVTQAQLYSDDLQDLAYYLTGTGGKIKKNIKEAFFITYTDTANGTKPIHANNICRVLAQNIDVYTNDWIDSYYPVVPFVPGDQIVRTFP